MDVALPLKIIGDISTSVKPLSYTLSLGLLITITHLVCKESINQFSSPLAATAASRNGQSSIFAGSMTFICNDILRQSE